MDKENVQHMALMAALDYHSRIYGPVNIQAMPHTEPTRPTSEQIVETARAFANFLEQ